MLLLVKDTKFESKSQLPTIRLYTDNYCFYWSKIQNLKANHNVNSTVLFNEKIAFTGQRYKIWKQITTHRCLSLLSSRLLLLVKDTKFESKSQHYHAPLCYTKHCFYWSKIQNLKANHNWQQHLTLTRLIAFTGQRYKIWKQITTTKGSMIYAEGLLLLVKDTKFESKSQHASHRQSLSPYCFYWSKIQNLKANHNSITMMGIL